MDTWFEYSDLFVNRRYQVQWGVCGSLWYSFSCLFQPFIQLEQVRYLNLFIS